MWKNMNILWRQNMFMLKLEAMSWQVTDHSNRSCYFFLGYVYSSSDQFWWMVDPEASTITNDHGIIKQSSSKSSMQSFNFETQRPLKKKKMWKKSLQKFIKIPGPGVIGIGCRARDLRLQFGLGFRHCADRAVHALLQLLQTHTARVVVVQVLQHCLQVRSTQVATWKTSSGCQTCGDEWGLWNSFLFLDVNFIFWFWFIKFERILLHHIGSIPSWENLATEAFHI